MFVGVNHDIWFIRQSISPLVLDIFNNTRRELVPPTRIDNKCPADTGKSERALVGQAGFLEELAGRRVCMRFPVIETSRNGLPEIERLAATEQQNVTSIAVHNDQDGNGATVFRRTLLFGARRPQPDTGFFQLLR